MEEVNNIRPKCFSDYIGQTSIKLRLAVAVASARQRKDAMPHVLLDGPPGLGKTTLATIIANELGAPYHQVLSTAIDSQDALSAMLGKFPHDGYDARSGKLLDRSVAVFPVIFIDEIHRLKSSITELFHTILEDYTVTFKTRNPRTDAINTERFWIPRFTLIGATNYLGALPKPFTDRFPVVCSFEIYTTDDMIQILSGVASRIKIPITQEALSNIADKSRGIPRIANHYLMRCYDVFIAFGSKFGSTIAKDCVAETFAIHEIDNIGLSKSDRRVLQYLASMNRPVGILAIAQAVDINKKTVEVVIEPWLVRQGLIVRTPQGRIISDAGIRHLFGGGPLSENQLRRIET